MQKSIVIGIISFLTAIVLVMTGTVFQVFSKNSAPLSSLTPENRDVQVRSPGWQTKLLHSDASRQQNAEVAPDSAIWLRFESAATENQMASNLASDLRIELMGSDKLSGSRTCADPQFSQTTPPSEPNLFSPATHEQTSLWERLNQRLTSIFDDQYTVSIVSPSSETEHYLLVTNDANHWENNPALPSHACDEQTMAPSVSEPTQS